METIVSTVTLKEDVNVKKMAAADETKDKVEESQIPAITLPAHTSPGLGFASEVTSQCYHL